MATVTQYYFVVNKTGDTTDSAYVVTTATTGGTYTSLASGKSTFLNGVHVTKAAGGGPFSTKSAADSALGLIQLAQGTTQNTKTGKTSNTGLAAIGVGNPVWWNVALTATPLVNPKAIQAPSTAFAASNTAKISGKGYTQIPANFGPYVTQADAEGAITGWIVAPEGTAGEIVNALATYADAEKAGAEGNVVSEVSDYLKDVGDAAGATTYTTTQLTGAGPIAGAEKAGTTVYVNQSDAAAKSASQTSGSNGGWEQDISSFFGDITSANLWIRAAKITIGGIILIVGLVKLTGADQKVGGVAAKAVKIAPLL